MIVDLRSVKYQVVLRQILVLFGRKLKQGHCWIVELSFLND